MQQDTVGGGTTERRVELTGIALSMGSGCGQAPFVLRQTSFAFAPIPRGMAVHGVVRFFAGVVDPGSKRECSNGRLCLVWEDMYLAAMDNVVRVGTMVRRWGRSTKRLQTFSKRHRIMEFSATAARVDISLLRKSVDLLICNSVILRCLDLDQLINDSPKASI